MKVSFSVPITISLLSILGIVLLTCTESTEDSLNGEKLAAKYCTSCHQLPDPAMLATNTWEEILPQMSAKMGIYVSAAALEHRQLLEATNMTLEKPMLSAGEWLQIKTYYMESSPDSLPYVRTEISKDPLNWFSPVPLIIGSNIPASSLVEFDRSKPVIYYGDAVTRRLYAYSLEKQSTTEYQLDGAPSGLIQHPNGPDILTMGNIHPNDLFQGKLTTVQSDSMTPILEGLPRPVHVSQADLNGDGREDYVVSGFGYLKGELSWYEQLDSGTTRFQKHILNPLPGALKTSITDLDGDGHLDILALMAQGDEGFYMYKGNGKGKFEAVRLLSFSPSFGSSYYELQDMNGDNHLDIVYANGDNGDYSRPVVKPYHGIRIFINSGTGMPAFEEKYFFPMNGPFKAMVDDYNLDGYPDIACISYFPDYERTPEESFLILRNTGAPNLDFVAHALPESLDGKWLTADRFDYDNDGDIDILLGNGPIMSLYVPDSLKQKWEKQPVTVLLLENNSY